MLNRRRMLICQFVAAFVLILGGAVLWFLAMGAAFGPRGAWPFWLVAYGEYVALGGMLAAISGGIWIFVLFVYVVVRKGERPKGAQSIVVTRSPHRVTRPDRRSQVRSAIIPTPSPSGIWLAPRPSPSVAAARPK